MKASIDNGRLVVVLELQVGVDIDELAAHTGATLDGTVRQAAQALLEHVRFPIEEPCFDTPATLRVRGLDSVAARERGR